MDSKQLSTLNGLLAELGSIGGKQRYLWVWSAELETPEYVGDVERQLDSGVILLDRQCRMVPQVDGDPRWVVALFIEPPSKQAWASQFGLYFPYPSHGYYVSTEIALRVGAEPDEELTREVVEILSINSELSYGEHYDNYMEVLAKRELEKQKRIDDAVDEAVPAFYNPTPGKRGGNVSFGGIE